MRYKQAYTLVPRSTKNRKTVWYYRLGGDPERKKYASGKTSKTESRLHAEALIEEKKSHGSIERAEHTLGKYCEPYFVWDRCPYIRNLREEGKSITKRHAANRRRLVERFFEH